MRKLIDIPEENKVLEKLQIFAVKAKKVLFCIDKGWTEFDDLID